MSDKPNPFEEILITVAPSFKMRVGINYAWWANKYGVFLGNNTVPWEEDFEKTLDAWGKLKVRLVRVFMLGNLSMYGTVVGTGPTAVFTPPPACPTEYIDGTVRLLKIVKKAGARAVLSLTNFLAFCTIGDGATHKHAIITTPGLRKRFFDDVLEPMLVASLPFKDQILAWEVMNEPIWSTSNVLFNPGNQRGAVAALSQVKDFLEEGISRIDAHGFASTVGHANVGDLVEFPRGTLRQFHFYPTTFWGNKVGEFDDTKAFVGEISPIAAVKTPFLELQENALLRDWPELEGKDGASARIAVFERLRLLNDRGYRFAFLWPDDHDNENGFQKLNAAAKLGIADYNAL